MLTTPRLFYLKPDDWTWWVWTLTAILLLLGLLLHPAAYLAAIALTLCQTLALLLRDRSLTAFSVQLRIAYLLLLLICYLPFMRWLYWLPTLGTFALVLFGYCLLARCLSLLPWNSREPYTLDRLRRTFLSPPDLSRVQPTSTAPSCAGGLCTIAAQVAPPASKHPAL